MILAALIGSATAAQADAVPVDPAVSRMIVLYEEVCLGAFPDDAALDTLMARKGARPLTAEEVKVTLVDDPGRRWLIADGARQIQVTVETPPYRTCSVRRMTERGFGDLAAYAAALVRFKASHPGFAPIRAMEFDRAGLRIHATGESRPMAGGGAENLLLYEQRVIDPARVAAGEMAVNIRFVHQIAPPAPR